MKKFTLLNQFLLLILFINLCPILLSGQQIYINEFLTSNATINLDEFGENDDWVELYNGSSNAVDLSGMYLTDNFANMTQWSFPSGTTIAGNGFLLIWCDNDEIQGPLHTNFKLSASGESIALIATDGFTVIDSYTYGLQTTDISTGREEDGQLPWVAFTAPTPNSTNDAAIGSTIAATPVATLPGGHYNSNFTVGLSTTTQGATIRYTTDGSVPTSSSSSYNNPITIDETTTLRARAFKNNMEPSRTMTHTYLYNISHTLPIVCLSTDDDNFFGDEAGIYENWDLDIEQPVHVELFEADGTFGFRQDLGIKVHGGFSASKPHKGLALVARDEYGDDDIDYQLFPDLNEDKFKAFLLRASGNDQSKTLFRDAFCSDLVRRFDDVDPYIKDPDFDLQYYRPSIVYLNGSYFGIHNIREKMDFRYVKTHYGVSKENVDIIVREDDIERGMTDAWEEFYDYYDDNDLSDPAVLDSIRTYIDLDHYLDYFIHNIFIDNNDWPDNNNRRWRERAPGKKWRFFLYDMDRGFGLDPLVGDNNSGDWRSPSLEMVFADVQTYPSNEPWSTLLLRKLMDNDEIRLQFINRMADQLNIIFDTDRLLERIDTMQAPYIPEIEQHDDFWWDDEDEWYEDVDILRLFSNNRNQEMWEQYEDYFSDITGIANITVETSPLAGGVVHLNTMNLFEPIFPWSGQYFEGVDVPLYATANPGYIFTGWTPSSLGTDPVTTMNLSGNTDIVANYTLGSTQAGNIVINEINYHSLDICDSGDWIELYNAGSTSVDISGWFLEDEGGNYFNVPSGTILPGQGYLVLAEDAVRFQAVHPTVTNFVAGFGNSLNGEVGLSNGGEWISINNADRSFMDTVSYDDSAPWPTMPDGFGPTLQLISHTLDNALASSWIASAEAKGTPGEPNQGVLFLGPNTVLCNTDAITLDAGYQPCFSCSYSWSNGATTPTITVNPALGTNFYAVTVTEIGGTTQIDDITIDLSSPYSLSSTHQDLLCSDHTNGSIDLTVTGSGPYTYSWTNGANTQDINNITSGTYTVTVSDALFCTQTEVVNVSAPAALIANGDDTPINCFGELASIDVFVSGGTGTYNYLWSNGAVVDDLVDLSAGDYSLTVTDFNNCSTSLSYSFSEPEEITGSFDIENGCNGLANGFIDVDMEGGVGDYFYEWSNGEATTSDDLEDLDAGIYIVTVTDDTGCTWSSSAEVTASTTMAGEYDINDLSCTGDNSGSIGFIVDGGNTPYDYSWSNDSTTNNLQNLAAGPYLITVTDDSGCQFYDSVYVAEPTLIFANSVIDTISCFGATDAVINIEASGGTGSYDYAWSDGSSEDSLEDLPVGNYGLTISDQNNCSSSYSFVIEEPLVLEASTQAVNILCNGSATGAVILNATGGTGPYSYLWSNDETTANLTAVVAGTYDVTISDANNCSIVQSQIITENDPITANHSQTNIECNGLTTGSINLNVSGGQSPYSYQWETGEITDNLDNLAAGTYLVTITDANTCTEVQSLSITEPEALAIEANETNLLCNSDNTGFISLQVEGGTMPYSYEWNTGATTDTIGGLAADDYIVTVTDNNNCSTVQEALITEASPLVSSLVSENISCFGMDNGLITPIVNGGTTPYTYEWDTGAEVANLNDLSPDQYILTITDANGCTQIQSAEITEPSEFVNSYDSEDILCNGDETGSITITPTGGVSPYSYLWNTDEDSDELVDLIADDYTVTITDENNCTQVETITISEPAAISIEIEQVDVFCNSDDTGSISLQVEGGETPYDYEWNTGDTTDEINNLDADDYTITITDDNDCILIQEITIIEASDLSSTFESTNVSCFGVEDGQVGVSVDGGTSPYSYEWNTGDEEAELSSLAADDYTVTITDDNGCTQIQEIEIMQPDLLENDYQSTDVACNSDETGSIIVTPTGGTSPYSYEWNTNEDSDELQDLAADIYTVTITDDNNCTQIQSIEITEPESINTQTTLTHNLCFGDNSGEIVLSTSGGNNPYDYEWSNGDNNGDIDNLEAGEYTVTITDDNECTYTNTVNITEPTELEINTQTTDPECNGFATGSIDISPTGGVGAYAYEWSTGDETQDIDNVNEGNYSVTITDGNDCSENFTIAITEPSPVVNNVITSDVSCNGGNDGVIDLNTSGGVGPYQYAWNNGIDTEISEVLTAGNYEITISDDNGCTEIQNIGLTEPSPIGYSNLQLTNNDCFDAAEGLIAFQTTGGSAPYDYEWSTGSNQNSINSLAQGDYTLTITDDHECIFTEIFTITAPTAIGIQVQSLLVNCFGESNGAINLNISGGSGGYEFIWNTGMTTEDLANLPAGSYTVTVSDLFECESVETIVITEPELLQSLATPSAVTCNGSPTGSINLVVNGGTQPYSYIWSNGSTDQSPQNLAAGNYAVTIIDAHNCENIQQVAVTEPTVLEASFTQTNNLCNGAANGSISSITSGGSGPYTYLWATGETTADISSLAADNYSVTITDQNNCTFSESFSITAPDALSANWETMDASCYGGANGTVDLSITGGVADYAVMWSNGINTEDLDNLSAGTYTATISDANNCVTNISNVIIGQTDSMITIPTEILNLTCDGLFPGSITTSTTGGNLIYTYVWSTGDITPSILAENSGAYFVTVTDQNQCSSEASFELGVEDGLTIEAQLANASCFGDEDAFINITVTGGSNQYEYDWSTGDNSVSAANIGAGVYSVTVVDSENCPASDTFLVSQPTELMVTENFTDPINGMDGSISIIPEGGTIPYSIEWNTGATTFELNNLEGGTYSYIFTDDNGCTFEGSVDLAIVDALTNTAAIDLNIYPNPTSGMIHIESNLNQMEVIVIDMLGRHLQHFTKTQQQLIWTLDLGNLTTGLYYLEVQTEEGKVIERIVVE